MIFSLHFSSWIIVSGECVCACACAYVDVGVEMQAGEYNWLAGIRGLLPPHCSSRRWIRGPPCLSQLQAIHLSPTCHNPKKPELCVVSYYISIYKANINKSVFVFLVDCGHLLCSLLLSVDLI